MDISNVDTGMTIRKLYDLIGEERIMSTYHYPVDLKKVYVNPYREDVHPGCFYKWTKNGRLFFVDYGTDVLYFDALDMAQLKTGYGFPAILYKVMSDFNLINITASDLAALQEESLNTTKEVRPPSEIRVKPRFLRSSDYRYWNDYGVTPDILELYGVTRAKIAWIQRREKWETWYIDNDLDPCYVYPEKGKFKLYRPFARRESKFRSSLTGGILEGWTQLPETGEDLIITKGRKDVMMFKALGINAEAVRSENTPVSDNAYSELRDRFKNIRIWFDNDEAGVAAAAKREEELDIPVIHHPADWPKDPSDIYKLLGKEAVLKWL